MNSTDQTVHMNELLVSGNILHINYFGTIEICSIKLCTYLKVNETKRLTKYFRYSEFNKVNIEIGEG